MHEANNLFTDLSSQIEELRENQDLQEAKELLTILFKGGPNSHG